MAALGRVLAGLLALAVAPLARPAAAVAFGEPDPSYEDKSYSCIDYTPLLRGKWNIVEFRCMDGRCIKIRGKCNGVSNCEDGSDEAEEVCKERAKSSKDEQTSTSEAATTTTSEAATTTTSEAATTTPEATASSPCHTALKGEECHVKVEWAMQHGIDLHPEWYEGLTAESSFEAFQDLLHRNLYGHCPRPCGEEWEEKTTTTEATTTLTEAFVDDDSINRTLACSQHNILYQPMDMPGHPMAIVSNVSACQARCREVPTCVHFSYYTPLNNCHLQDRHAKLYMNYVNFIVGPPDCGTNESVGVNYSHMNFRRKFLSRPGRTPDIPGALSLPLAAGLGAMVVASGLAVILRRVRGGQAMAKEAVATVAPETALLEYACEEASQQDAE